jgi:hypothetical protein
MDPVVHFEMPYDDPDRIARFCKPEWPAPHPSVVVAVQDIRSAMSRVAAAGGQVLGEPMEIPGVGQYVSFHDTEGHRVGTLEPAPRGAPRS